MLTWSVATLVWKHTCISTVHVLLISLDKEQLAERCFNSSSVLQLSHVMRQPVMPYANNKGADQPAHPCSLISAFVVRCLDSMIPPVSISKISSLCLTSVAAQAVLSLSWSQIPKTGFLVTRFIYTCVGLLTICYMYIILILQELLTILFREGPYTVGILRKSPNAKMLKELRQKIDDGEDCLCNETWPTLVIGALLKVRENLRINAKYSDTPRKLQ